MLPRAYGRWRLRRVLTTQAQRWLTDWTKMPNTCSHGWNKAARVRCNIWRRISRSALTQTVVCCVLSYYKENPQPKGAPYIALSGLSERDYHEVVKEKLRALETRLKNEFGEQVVNAGYQHIFCDSAPVLERAWARECGLGWIGKNRQFIHPKLGSYVHLGILFLSDALQPDSCPSAPADLCRPRIPGRRSVLSS